MLLLTEPYYLPEALHALLLFVLTTDQDIEVFASIRQVGTEKLEVRLRICLVTKLALELGFEPFL